MTEKEGMRPRVAVIGTGAISQIVHVPILAEREDVDLAVLADADEAKARTVAERFDVPEVLDPESALRREDLDAVVLCTPAYAHEQLAVAALEAGMALFVERPIALDGDGAERIVAAARESGAPLVVGLPHRFRPEVVALRSFVAGGELGDPYAVRGSWLTRKVPAGRPSWRHDPTRGGGAMMDLGVSALDLCLWLVGYPEITRVTAVMHRSEFEVEDAATLMMESAAGVVFTLEVSSRYYAGEDRYFARVMGADGSGSLPPLEIYRKLGGRPLDVTPRQPRPRGGENLYMNAYRRLLDHFIRVVAGSAEAPLPDQQVALMRVIDGAYRSDRERREVPL
ncbi:MAG: Gfo/Idh/MocA family oxidoreductase [Gemmatimonadota bacterium]